MHQWSMYSMLSSYWKHPHQKILLVPKHFLMWVWQWCRPCRCRLALHLGVQWEGSKVLWQKLWINRNIMIIIQTNLGVLEKKTQSSAPSGSCRRLVSCLTGNCHHCFFVLIISQFKLDSCTLHWGIFFKYSTHGKYIKSVCNCGFLKKTGIPGYSFSLFLILVNPHPGKMIHRDL